MSQIVKGDGEKQDSFAKSIGLNRIGPNNVTNVSRPTRAFSVCVLIIFLAFGLAVPPSLDRYPRGGIVPLYIC